MAQFKKGDNVKVRLDTSSPYRGRAGVIAGTPTKDSFGFEYAVKFESQGFIRNYRFLEQDLEPANI